MNTSTDTYRGNITERKVLKLQDECLNSIKNTLKIAANANEISRYGATRLNEQTEQLSKIEDDTEKIRNNLDKTREAISSIRNPILFWFKGLFRGEQRVDYSEKTIPKESNTNDKNKLNEIQVLEKDLEKYKCKDSDIVLKSCNSNENQFSEQIDEGLNQIGDILNEMHSRAVSMNLELKNQGEIMNKINNNINDNNIKMKNQRRELGKLIGK
ncbi:SMART 2xt_SNARE domain containing protein [Cryptosporidium xiaoi]|uniref:SMART 2xt_SNARE domain containing protein n=1 Tax=Cryptosporidium xiaoi TaxID=659607 RepID=A0AAV9XY91_9CRYT